MNDIVSGIFEWIKNDYQTNRFRFFIEVCGWAVSIFCALTMALTVPDPPLLLLYPAWISGCIMYSWAAYSRKSFGMLANYILLTAIDTIGLIRILS